MSCVIRCGPHCHRMVVKVKILKALKEIGEIERTVCQRLVSRGCGSSLCLGVPQKLEQYIRLGGYIGPLSKFLILFFPGKLPLSLAALPRNAMHGLFNCVRSRRHLTAYLLGSPDCMRADWHTQLPWKPQGYPVWFLLSPRVNLAPSGSNDTKVGVARDQEWAGDCATGKLLRISSLNVLEEWHTWQENFLPHSYWCINFLVFLG